jgi:hypothetical protein
MPRPARSFSLAGSERPRPDTHRHMGPFDPAKIIGVTVLVRSRPGSPPLPDLDDWHNAPLAERRALTREEYAGRHGADPADLHAVAQFASQHGLHVAESHVGRRAVTLEGPAEKLGAAFGVELQEYEAPVHTGGPRPGSAAVTPTEPATYTHHGYDGQVMLPKELGGIVVAVVGLDDRIRGVRAGGPTAGGNDPAGAAFISPVALAQHYNFPTSGAKDQTIGVFAGPGGAYQASDILNHYFPSLPSGYTTAPKLHDVDLTISGTLYQNNVSAVTSLTVAQINAGQGGGILELTQDISTSATIAQGATVNIYFNDNTEQGWLVFLSRVLQPETETGPSVVTVSWVFELGDDSSYIGTRTNNPLTPSSSIVDWMTPQFQALAAVGVDVFIAQGDWGADNWFPLSGTAPRAPDGKSHVMYPGTDPWVTSCGGTVVGTSEEWTWGDTYTTSSFGSAASNRAATGGGVSATFPAPLYQTSAGITGATDSASTVQSGRGVPDIAGMVAFSQVFFVNTSITYNFIGTSCVAPFYAGLAAVIKSALGRDLGPWNDTLYALKDVAFNDITKGNNDSGDTPTNVAAAFAALKAPPYTGTTPDAPYFSATSGWDACTGLGSIDGTKLLNGIASLLYNPTFYFQVNKGSFGLDEVNVDADFTNPTPMWLVLEGFTPNAVVAAGITPTVTALLGGITVTVGAAVPEIATALDTPQRIYFPCSVKFASSAVKTIAQGGIFPPPGSPPTPTEVTLVAPSVTIADQILPAAETVVTLEPGADPYFANYATNGDFYLSQDLRVFAVTPGVQKAPIEGIALNPTDNYHWDTAAGYDYIKRLLGHLNGNFGSPGQDLFASFPDQTNALSGDSSVTPTSIDPSNPTGPGLANYNFAVARVRLDGAPNSSSGANVRVLFRLFAAQTGDTDFNLLTYPSSLDAEGQPLSPQLGLGDVTIPFFATGNYEANTDFAAQNDYPAAGTSINNQPVPIGPSGQAYAYYGCYLNIYPTANTIGGVAVQTLLPSSHSCVVAQLIYDDAPTPTGPGALQGPEWSDTFAQRNLQITFSDNPGPPATHRVPQTFDVRPSPAPGAGDLEQYPDELMISWGETPVGSTASIYWPAVASADVLALANSLYSTHQLSAADANTIQCTVPKGITSVPIPVGTGPNFAGLFTIELPPSVTTGEILTVTVRRVSTHQGPSTEPTPPPPPPPPAPKLAGGGTMAATERGMTSWRYIVGTFAVRIPVTTSHEMLPAEEDTLAIIKWRLAQLAPSNRWVPVLKRWIGLIEGRVSGLGVNPAKIEPSPWGASGPPKLGPGRGHGPKPDPGHRPGEGAEHWYEATGKVNGVVYDRFGDFAGFGLLSEEGHEHHYHSRENEIEALARYAWVERVVITVLSEDRDRADPVRIILRRAP